jgi:alanine-glyoxylate transaminase / serine-glyoxylate transaminase / serine-pyruvate transaminase
MTISGSFHPPRRVLMGPGPSDVPPRVLEALARPTVGHLDPAFVEFMESLKDHLRYAFRTANDLTFAVSGPGSAGMEAALVNLIEPGDTVAVCRNGVFGGRMADIAARAGAEVTPIDSPWGEPVDPAAVDAALAAIPGVRLLAFVHGETSTGARSDAAALAAIARRHRALSVADCVTTLGGIPVEIDAWGIDAAYSGSQKCLSAPPGLSPITFGPRAAERIRARKTPVQSWFLDVSLLMSYWGSGTKRSYHHTAPVNALYGLHEALVILREEGLEAAWDRHRLMHESLAAGLAELGIRFLVAEESRLPQLNAVLVPEGIDDAAVRRRLLDEFGLEIGGGMGDLAGKIWRIGLMGSSARRENVTLVLRALGAALSGNPSASRVV